MWSCNSADIRMDSLFSPSIWSKRYPTQTEVLNAHCTFAKTESERVRQIIPFEVVQYGNVFTNETFDIFGTDLPKDAPILVWIHGGYWQELDKTISAYTVEPLYKAGHKVIVLDYENCPKITLEQLVDQVQRAGIFIVNYAKSMRTSCIQLCGHSAGAQLCMALFDKLVRESPAMIANITAMYLLCGVYDVFEVQHWPVVNSNGILSLNENNSLRLSPILYEINKWVEAIKQFSIGVIPTAIHLYTVEYEAPKLLGQTYAMERVLALSEYPNFDLTLVKNHDHFSIAEDLSKSEFLITKQIITEAKIKRNID